MNSYPSLPPSESHVRISLPTSLWIRRQQQENTSLCGFQGRCGGINLIKPCKFHWFYHIKNMKKQRKNNGFVYPYFWINGISDRKLGPTQYSHGFSTLPKTGKAIWSTNSFVLTTFLIWEQLYIQRVFFVFWTKKWFFQKSVIEGVLR